jgi:hypothetical protein
MFHKCIRDCVTLYVIPLQSTHLPQSTHSANNKTLQPHKQMKNTWETVKMCLELSTTENTTTLYSYLATVQLASQVQWTQNALPINGIDWVIADSKHSSRWQPSGWGIKRAEDWTSINNRRVQAIINLLSVHADKLKGNHTQTKGIYSNVHSKWTKKNKENISYFFVSAYMRACECLAL